MAAPGGEAAAWTTCMRRSAFVNVPDFSRKDAAGRITCAKLEVSFSKISWTTRNSRFESAATTWSTSGSDCAMS